MSVPSGHQVPLKGQGEDSVTGSPGAEQFPVSVSDISDFFLLHKIDIPPSDCPPHLHQIIVTALADQSESISGSHPSSLETIWVTSRPSSPSISRYSLYSNILPAFWYPAIRQCIPSVSLQQHHIVFLLRTSAETLKSGINVARNVSQTKVI